MVLKQPLHFLPRTLNHPSNRAKQTVNLHLLVVKVHNKAIPTRFPTIISITRISTTDLPTIPGTVFPSRSSNTRRCFSPVPLGLLPVPPSLNKPHQTSNTPTHTVRTSMVSSILQVRMMIWGTTTSIRTLVAHFQGTTTSNYTETPVSKASWAVWVRLLVDPALLGAREVDPRE